MTAPRLDRSPGVRLDAPRAQTYSNHRRVFPLYHYVAAPAFAANILVRLIGFARAPGAATAWELVMALGLAAALVASRTSVLIVQNRLIRLETRARLALVLPPELRWTIGELRTRQLIGLRFASDAELPALVRRCVSGELRTADAVKRAVRDWQPDWLRA